MATFHQFPCLPSELRAKIWELNIEPRAVDVSVSNDYLRDKGPLPVTSTPVPAPLQTCQESRLELQKYYQRGLSELGDGNEPRYVWIDFEVDIVSIGSTEFCVYERVALSPRRLQFEGENSDDLFYHFGMKDLMLFRHLKEVFVVCKDGFSSWAGALEDHLWPCDVDNIWMIDPVDGKMVKGAEVSTIFEMESRERTLRMFYDYDTGLPILPFIEDAIEQEQ